MPTHCEPEVLDSSQPDVLCGRWWNCAFHGAYQYIPIWSNMQLRPQRQVGNVSQSWKSEKWKNFTSLVLGHAPSEVAVVENVLRHVWRCDMTSHHNRHGVGCCHKRRETVLKLEAADKLQLYKSFRWTLGRAVCHWHTERVLASPNKLNPVQQNQRAKAQLCCHWQKPWTRWKFDKCTL